MTGAKAQDGKAAIAGAGDAVMLATILRNRIESHMKEMHHHFFRSGYSTIVRESRDFSCVLLTPKGELLVAPPMFYHATVYRQLVARIVELYGPTLAQGDLFVANHPYEGGLPHVPDMAVVAPAVADGQLVGFAALIAHKADLGGAVPGSVNGQATDLFQEGLLVPPMRLARAGVRDRDVERIIAANSRTPDLVMGDLSSQAGIAAIGADRLRELAARFGTKAMLAGFDAIGEAALAGLAAALANLPEGRQAAEVFMDSDGVRAGVPVRWCVAVTVGHGRISFDFTGSDPEAGGPVNLRPALVQGCCYYALIGFLGPGLTYCDRFADLVDVVLPAHSVVNADAPAPVSNYMMSCHRVVDLLLEALAPFRPERAIAHSGGSGGAITVAWGGGRNNLYELFGSAYGATGSKDGANAVSVHLANLYITPVEIIESEFPCRVKAFELIPDSGGVGRQRGGVGFRRHYRVDVPATLIYRADRGRFPPRGIAGAGPGRQSRLLVDPQTQAARDIRGSARVELRPGMEFVVETAGGGGYGPASERRNEARARDIADGYVTEKGVGSGVS